MSRSLAALAAGVLLFGALACSGPAPAAGAGSPLLSRFRDPFGRAPVALSMSAGAHVRIAYVDSLFDTHSPLEQRRQAHIIARYLWEAFAVERALDTVSVAFTRRVGKGAAVGRQTTRTFLFYPEQLQAAQQLPGAPAAP